MSDAEPHPEPEQESLTPDELPQPDYDGERTARCPDCGNTFTVGE